MVILWGKTPIWYSESIDEPATITMTVPSLSSFDETSTFLGLWEIRPAGVQLHFAATANEKISINADFRPSAFIITHIKAGTKPRRAVVLTFDGVIVDELLSPKVFKERHELTSERLHSGTNPTRIIFLDTDGAVINAEVSRSVYTQIFDRAGTKPRDAVTIGAEHIKIDEHGETSRFIIEPSGTSEELHSGVSPARIVFLDEGAAGIAQRVSAEAFSIEFERSGKKPSLLGSSDAAGVATQVSPVTYSVKYRKCGTGRTKS